MTQTTPSSVDAMREALEPYKDHNGPLPDFDSPLAGVFDSGVQYAVELLAKELGVTDWTPCDGTEEYDGDLGGTLMNIVCAAMPLDKDGERMWPSDVRKTLSTLPSDGVTIPAGMKPWHGGDAAPEDWDRGPVKLRDGTMWSRLPGWQHEIVNPSRDVIAYTPKAPPVAQAEGVEREIVEAECAALLAAYLRKEIGRLMQQAEHWAANDKPLAVHHRLMKADNYFQILVLMERDPVKGWKLPFDEIRDSLKRPSIYEPGAYPPSADLYRYRDPAFVVAALSATTEQGGGE